MQSKISSLVSSFTEQSTDTPITQMLTYEWLAYAKSDFLRRKCSTSNYRIVKLKTVKVERIIELDSEKGYEIQNKDWEENT